MTKDKHWKAFCLLIQGADEALAAKPRSELALGMMFRILQRYDFKVVQEAVEEHMRQGDFVVKPADIIRYIDGTAADRAALAWRMVVRAMQRLGHYDSVRFPLPAYHYAIEQMGGWQGLCQRLTDEELHFREKDFARFFEIGERVASWDHEPGKVHVLPYLVGFYEADNRARGYALPAVKDAETGLPLPEMRPALGSGEDERPVFLRALAEGMRSP